MKQFLYLTIQENQCNRHSSTACNQAQRDANQSQNKGFIQDGLPLLRPGSPTLANIPSICVRSVILMAKAFRARDTAPTRIMRSVTAIKP